MAGIGAKLWDRLYGSPRPAGLRPFRPVAGAVPGFRHFDERDLLGFVDGTESPTGAAGRAAVRIGDSHLTLNTIVDADGTQRQIVRDNMPFGRIGEGEFGTYFVGYVADPGVIEQMLQNMF